MKPTITCQDLRGGSFGAITGIPPVVIQSSWMTRWKSSFSLLWDEINEMCLQGPSLLCRLLGHACSDSHCGEIPHASSILMFHHPKHVLDLPKKHHNSEDFLTKFSTKYHASSWSKRIFPMAKNWLLVNHVPIYTGIFTTFFHIEPCKKWVKEKEEACQFMSWSSRQEIPHSIESWLRTGFALLGV